MSTLKDVTAIGDENRTYAHEDMRAIEIEIGDHGSRSRVLVNGQDVRCYQAIITAEVGEVTRVELYCYGIGHKPYILKGRMVVEEDTSQEATDGQ